MLYRHTLPFNIPKRSKNEIRLYKLLKDEFPNLNIIPNDRYLFNGLEADIAIPSLSIVIEWNGTQHYKPIFGQKSFKKVQNNDKRKLLIAQQKNINLIVIPDFSTDKDIVQKAFQQTSSIVKQQLNLQLPVN
jgi:hypothetical protein